MSGTWNHGQQVTNLFFQCLHTTAGGVQPLVKGLHREARRGHALQLAFQVHDVRGSVGQQLLRLFSGLQGDQCSSIMKSTAYERPARAAFI